LIVWIGGEGYNEFWEFWVLKLPTRKFLNSDLKAGDELPAACGAWDVAGAGGVVLVVLVVVFDDIEFVEEEFARDCKFSNCCCI
jgi:hypothetical protein